jgi:hypothetical protein
MYLHFDRLFTLGMVLGLALGVAAFDAGRHGALDRSAPLSGPLRHGAPQTHASGLYTAF